MKAAVIHEFGSVPRYEDFADPIAQAGDLIVRVKAVALENFDKMTAGGVHYASRHMFPQFPAVVGHGGAGTLPDGKLVAFGGTRPPYGTMAEYAVIPKEYAAYVTQVPNGVDPAVAAALPASALTSLLPLKWGAKLQQGETVLIHGATGVSGRLGVQIAALLGAGRIIGTGRDEANLRSLPALGASATIDLKQPDKQICEALARESGEGYDVVLDFLWGHPTELLFGVLTPTAAGFAKHRTRYVQIGEAAGPTIVLPAGAVRTSGLEIAGAGNIPAEVVPESVAQVWEWVRNGKLTMEIEETPLSDIAEAWNRKTPGKRIVILP